MPAIATWWPRDDDPSEGALELDESLTGGLGLELQLVTAGGQTGAWWVDHWGRCWGEARVGLA